MTRNNTAATERRHGLKVEVPSDEGVRLGRIGAIAAIGFVIGIVWPRLASMQLVPSAPVEKPETVASASPSADPPKAEAPAAATGPDETRSKLSGADRIKVTEVVVTSCRNDDGRDRTECDDIDWISVARPRLETLAACDGAEQVEGLLSIGFDLDFPANEVARVRSGKSSTIDGQKEKALVACAKKAFESASLKGLKHESAQYTVFLKVEFAPAAQAEVEGQDAEGGGDVVEASGRATVGWQVALIRSEPRKGDVVARILSGTNVVVTGRQGDWYRVKYDGNGNEGWVYRSAIGL